MRTRGGPIISHVAQAMLAKYGGLLSGGQALNVSLVIDFSTVSPNLRSHEFIA
jgi:hypothetical protein